MAKQIESFVIETDYRLYAQGKDRWQKAREQEDAALEGRRAEARAARPGDKLAGELVSWGRGDGSAIYMVVSSKPLVLQHIAVGDAWRVEDALIRGLNLNDVKVMVGREKALAELFKREGAK